MLQTASEAIGRVIGAMLAPVAAMVARLRGGRALHPAGTVCAGDLTATTDDPALADLAQRLAGAVIVRMSGALWRRPGKPEMLGCALRLRGPRALEVEPDPDDQDLLFATARAAWTVPLAMFRTDPDDYLHNVYYTLGCLDDDDLGTIELRLVPLALAVSDDDSRGERLVAAMTAGQARLRLELRRPHGRWQTLGELRLHGRLELDERALCFSPHQTGQGLRPRGFLHAMRGPTYAAGQFPRQA